MKITNLFKSKYLLAIIGLILIIVYIWNRYIRERLPKDVPFEFTLFNIILLITICLTYSYILLRILKPKPPHPLILQLMQELQPFFKPWYALHEVILESSYFHKFIIYLGKGLKYITNTERNMKLYISWYILPRVILLILLITDVLYLNKLTYIYTFGFLTLFILLCTYIIYCIRITINQYIEYLDYYFEIEITSIDYPNSNYFIDIKHLNNKYEMKIKDFINYQTAAIWFNNTLYEYKCIFVERYNTDAALIEISDKDRKNLTSEFYKLIPLTVSLTLFIETYDSTISKVIDIKKTDKITKMRIKLQRILIIITSLYLIIWAYVLIVSIKAFPINSIFLLCNTFIDTTEPFSETYLDSYLLIISFSFIDFFNSLDLLEIFQDNIEPFSQIPLDICI